MGGFGNELRQKIIGTFPHISIESPLGISSYIRFIDEIQSLDSIVAASPYLIGEGIIKYNNYTSGVVVRGIDSKRESKVTNLDQYLIRGSLPQNPFQITVGKVLAEDLILDVGDIVKLITPVHTKPSDFRVVGIFESGMYDYDVNFVFIDLFSSQKIYEAIGLVNGIGIKVDNPGMVDDIKQSLWLDIDAPYSVISWQDRNKNLFAALKLEKIVMFIILTMIIMVACFSITGTLIMVVMEKTKDIGILKSIGASNRFIRRIFTYQGFIFGITGALVGTSLGLGICFILSKYKFITLPILKDVYYVDALPVQVQFLEVAIIGVSAIVLSVMASIYPAIHASRLNPAEGIRYE